jgi:hypothetical protein
VPGIDQSLPAIGCAVCLNIKGDRRQATTIVSGFAVCDEHVELASHPEFSIWRLRHRGRGAV